MSDVIPSGYFDDADGIIIDVHSSPHIQAELERMSKETLGGTVEEVITNLVQAHFEYSEEEIQQVLGDSETHIFVSHFDKTTIVVFQLLDEVEMTCFLLSAPEADLVNQAMADNRKINLGWAELDFRS